MMKKNNEGYTLVLVLVVMVVLCLVSVSVMTFSLRNLQNQQKSVERMQAKYEAMGLLEMTVVQLEQSAGEYSIEQNNATESDAVSHWFEANGIELPDDTTIEVTEKAFSYSVDLDYDSTVEDTPYAVKCTILVSGSVELKEDDLHQTTGYEISEVKVKYTSYEIGGAA